MRRKKYIDTQEEYKYVPLDDLAQVWTTYDLGVSSALLCVGYRLLSVDKRDPHKALFLFERIDGIEDLANQYFTDQLQVRARSFFDALKALKNKLYSE